jgi:phosphoenolpyruvate carboxykinase (ATP)
MLEALIERHGAESRLVNTGWTGGPYGVGRRMSIRHTRALLAAALDGSLARVSYRRDPHFGLMIPQNVPGIADEVLDPRASWADKAAYDATARDLVERFAANFASFAPHVGEDVRAAALRAA